MNSQIIIKPEHKIEFIEAQLISTALHNHFLAIKDGIHFEYSNSSDGTSVTMIWDGNLDSKLIREAVSLVRTYRGVLAPFLKAK